MRRNRKERREERAHMDGPDMMDGQMLWLLMQHLRRTSRRNVSYYGFVHTKRKRCRFPGFHIRFKSNVVFAFVFVENNFLSDNFWFSVALNAVSPNVWLAAKLFQTLPHQYFALKCGFLVIIMDDFYQFRNALHSFQVLIVVMCCITLQKGFRN